MNKKPRHVVQGILYGFKSAVIGTIMAAMSIVAVPFLGYQKNGPAGLVAGGATGVVYAAFFAIIGYGQALRTIWDGLIVTPTAIYAAHVGQVWNDSSQQYEYYYLDKDAKELASRSDYRNRNKTNNGAGVADMEYYDLLQVPTMASSKEIKRAYYRHARDLHPDKNPSPEASELFRKLHIAYVTLYDNEKRVKYDKYGITGSGGNNDENPLNFDPNVFYAVIFNSQLVEPYIGELTIASFTDDIFHLANSNNNNRQQPPDELLKLMFKQSGDDYKSQKRRLDIAMFLRTQVDPFVNGQLTADEFRSKCRMEASSISTGSLFGNHFLQTIGTALTLEARQFLGFKQLYSIPGFVSGIVSSVGKSIKRVKRLVHSIRKAFAVIRVFVEAVDDHQKQATSNSYREDLVFEDVFKEEQTLHKLLPAIMEMAWAYNAHDISHTLHGACHKLFTDAGANSRFKRMERAEAIKMLGEEFLRQAAAETTATSARNQKRSVVGNDDGKIIDDNDIMARLEVAYQLSSMKVRIANFEEIRFIDFLLTNRITKTFLPHHSFCIQHWMIGKWTRYDT
jgi:curved DNA-binding protein CbpA